MFGNNWTDVLIVTKKNVLIVIRIDFKTLLRKQKDAVTIPKRDRNVVCHIQKVTCFLHQKSVLGEKCPRDNQMFSKNKQ